MPKVTALLRADEREQYLQTVERELTTERRERELRSGEKRERLEALNRKLAADI